MRSIMPLALSLLLLPFAGNDLRAADYEVDTAHSALHFYIQHLGLGNTWGRFNDFTGTITYDDADLANSAVEVTAQVASVDTHNEKRDKHLRNADLFDAGTHPTMTFSGKGFTPVEGKAGHYTVTGTLTIRGTSQEVTVPFHKVGEGEHAFAKKPAIGFQGQFEIKPKEFGVGQGDVAAAIGDVATIIVALEAIAK